LILSLFIIKHGIEILYLLVYVNDMVIIGTNPTIKDEPSVHLKDFDDLHFFLGIEVIRHDNDILLSQHNYL
jgi:hypothetical protein